jgi:hypothetical protein
MKSRRCPREHCGGTLVLVGSDGLKRCLLCGRSPGEARPWQAPKKDAPVELLFEPAFASAASAETPGNGVGIRGLPHRRPQHLGVLGQAPEAVTRHPRQI